MLTVPGVFRPRSDGWLLAAHAGARVPPGATVLDPFTGSGILAIAAARAGAGATTAIDVSRRAVACTRLNARLNRVRVRALRGDLFGPVGAERFDLILANPPYLPGDADEQPHGGARAWEGGRDGRRLIDRLCLEAADHLAPGGELLLIHSSICDGERTEAMLSQAGLSVELLDSSPGPLGPLLTARAPELERRGLLAPGEREERVLVLSARAG